jgi:hypothetical protein
MEFFNNLTFNGKFSLIITIIALIALITALVMRKIRQGGNTAGARAAEEKKLKERAAEFRRMQNEEEDLNGIAGVGFGEEDDDGFDSEDAGYADDNTEAQ